MLNIIEIIEEMMRKAQRVSEHLFSVGFTAEEALYFAICFIAYQKAEHPRLFQKVLKAIDEIAEIFSVERGEENEE